MLDENCANSFINWEIHILLHCYSTFFFFILLRLRLSVKNNGQEFELVSKNIYLRPLSSSYRPPKMQIRKNVVQDSKRSGLISLLSCDPLRLLSIPSLHCLSIQPHDIYQLQFPIHNNIQRKSKIMSPIKQANSPSQSGNFGVCVCENRMCRKL